MCCWMDFQTAKNIICQYRDENLPPESIDADEDTFKYRCDQLWAVDDILVYLRDNWFENFPSELICDYIEDCRYRAKKYNDFSMGKVYTTAKQTAEDILRIFVWRGAM